MPLWTVTQFKPKCFPIDPPVFLEDAQAVLLWKTPVCLRAWRGVLIYVFLLTR